MMKILDQFIDTAINRLSSERGPMVSEFFIDLRAHFGRQRITQKLIDDTIALCNSRGVHATVDPMNNLLVTVHLDSCRFNPAQAAMFNTALSYTRQVHGNHL